MVNPFVADNRDPTTRSISVSLFTEPEIGLRPSWLATKLSETKCPDEFGSWPSVSEASEYY